MENRKRYDLIRLRADARQTVADIIEQKRRIRQPRYLPTAADYSRLHWLKEQATALCCLRAHHRSKLHLQGSPEKLAECARLIGAFEEKYILRGEVAA